VNYPARPLIERHERQRHSPAHFQLMAEMMIKAASAEDLLRGDLGREDDEND
jgi:hypothetical protein